MTIGNFDEDGLKYDLKNRNDGVMGITYILKEKFRTENTENPFIVSVQEFGKGTVTIVGVNHEHKGEAKRVTLLQFDQFYTLDPDFK